ncbi:hypothetical protein [Sphingomonas sp. 3-13AW]|uniref:hypothetical protein n=1 Tax=Sphingomonas sp. 3-13AW TaxID=3050450 RepID=UPI003BB79AD2
MKEISWPLWTMEMTPSSVTSDSYPIEVGVACWTAPTSAIMLWSSAINPYGVAGWEETDHEFLERIGFDESRLRQGVPPVVIARNLNDIFMSSTVYGKGGTTDIHLANRLNFTARVWPTYELKSWRVICERRPANGSSAWEIIRTAKGDAADRARGTMMGIAHLLGQVPSSRRVATMAVALPI